MEDFRRKLVKHVEQYVQEFVSASLAPILEMVRSLDSRFEVGPDH